MKTMTWLIDHALAVGLLLVSVVVLGGYALSVSPGAIGLACMAVVAFVSYLTVEEISRRG